MTQDEKLLRTERNMSPTQLWNSGVLDPNSQCLSAIRDARAGDLHLYVINPEVAAPMPDADSEIIVPDTFLSLDGNQLQIIQRYAEALNADFSNNYSIDAFLQLRDYITSL